MRSWWLAVVVASVVACSGPEGGGDGVDIDGGADIDADVSGDQFSVVSSDGFLAVPPPACTDGQFIDYDCDARTSLVCGGDTHIGTDESAAMDPCPVCVADSAADPTTCDGWEHAYGEFLAASISASCANYCDDTKFFCAGWEITNSCGTFALSLTAAIDEEVIIFAEKFATENCQPCGSVPQTTTGLGAEFDAYEPACIGHQCVLVHHP